MIKTRTFIFILLGAAALFFPFLGSSHLFDWDEINFAECAREMIVSGNYGSVQINYLPFWEKPPLFIWMQALSMKLFGINEFAARFPNAMCSLICVSLLYFIGKKLMDKTFAVIWTLMYLGSLLPHFYFKSGIIDPWFNLFIFSSIYMIYRGFEERKTSKFFFAGILIGMGVLTKGPVALLMSGIILVSLPLIDRKALSLVYLKHVGAFMLAVILAGGSWFIIEIANGNMHIVMDFINYQIRLLSTEDSGHGGPFYYHFIVLLFGCFPASIFAFGGFKIRPFPFHSYMLVLLIAVLVIFSIVKTKILHYSSLAYYPLTYIAAVYCYTLIKEKRNISKPIIVSIMIIGILVSLAFIAITFIEQFKEPLVSGTMINDEFAIANLQAEVSWIGIEWIAGTLLLSGLLYMLFKNFSFKTFIVFTALCTLSINLFISLVVPKVEGYSQRAAIEFYQSISEKDCYVNTLGFKSYAHLFYANTKETMDLDKMLNEETSKPCYFVCKIIRAEEFKSTYPQLNELYRKNGFVFFERRR